MTPGVINTFDIEASLRLPSPGDIERAIAASAESLREFIKVSNRCAELYRLSLQAISKCSLTGVEFGDYVQSVCDSALAGDWPECWNCGTEVHDGPCVGEG